MSHQPAASQNPFNPMTLASLAMLGEPNDASDYKKGRPITRVIENSGKIRFSTYLNIPEVNVPPLGAELNYLTTSVFLEEMITIGELAEKKLPYPDGKMTITVDTWFGKSQTRLEKPEKTCALTIGIDGEGICYLAIQHKNSKNIVHRFGPNYLEKVLNGSGENIDPAILSAKYFKSWARKMLDLITVNTILNSKLPVKRGAAKPDADSGGSTDVASSWSEFN
jgi:hypothetical protein